MYAAGPEPEPHHSCQSRKAALHCQAVQSPASSPAMPVWPQSTNPPGTPQNGTAIMLAAAGPAIAGLPLHIGFHHASRKPAHRLFRCWGWCVVLYDFTVLLVKHLLLGSCRKQPFYQGTCSSQFFFQCSKFY